MSASDGPCGARVLRATVLVAFMAIVLPLLGAAPANAAGEVRSAQGRLNALRCDAGPTDGKFGSHTRSAVIRFQSRHGLSQSGRLDQRTRQRLHARSAHRCDVRPVPQGSGKGRRVVISQRQNWVWLVGSDGRVVSQGGIIDNPGVLRRGAWRTGSYCGRPARVKRNSSGSLWLDDFVRFAPCGIGFHRIPRSMSSGAQIHADWLLGTNMAESHGCVRLSTGMAARLWDFTAPGGVPVHVV